MHLLRIPTSQLKALLPTLNLSARNNIRITLPTFLQVLPRVVIGLHDPLQLVLLSQQKPF